MFPESNLHKFGKKFIFVVKDGIVYNIDNVAPSNNFFYFRGLTFPLIKSETIQNMEKRYLRKNSDTFKKFQDRYSQTISYNHTTASNLQTQMDKNKCLEIFVTQAVPAYMGQIIKRNGEKIKHDKTITDSLLGNNFAIINKRIYPLGEINIPSTIRLNNRNYTLLTSRKTINNFEEEFQYHLEERLKKEVLQKIRESQKITEKVMSLDSIIRDLAIKGHVEKKGDCFEYADLGYTPKMQRIYCYIAPHFNKKTIKHYGKRKVALSVVVKPEGIGLQTMIIAKNKDQKDFHSECTSLCLGKSPNGTTPNQIIGSLYKSAYNIGCNTHTFHE